MLIDAHCHVMPPDFASRRVELSSLDSTFASLFSNPASRLATVEDLIRDMDADGVDLAVVMGIGWSHPEVARQANDYIIQSVTQHPGRLIGLCSVDPDWGSPAVDELERCVNAGLRGVGELHPDTQGFDITDPQTMTPLMATAARFEAPVLLHCSEPVGHQYPGKGHTTPDKVYKFISEFPGNTIICAHWGGGLPFYSLMPEVPKAFDNVYFDSAASPFLYKPEMYSHMSRLAGQDKVLFASDYPLMPFSRALRDLDAACLDHDTRTALLGGNAATLYRL